MLRLLSFLLLMSMASQWAVAQVSSPPPYREWEVTAFSGGSFVGDFYFPTSVAGTAQPTSRTVGIEYSSSYQLGLQCRQNLGEYWAAELEYSFANQPLRFTDLTPQIQSLPLSQSVHHFFYSGSYQALSYRERLRPYVRVGAGASLFYIHGSSKSEAADLGINLRDSWKFTVSLGGGFKYLIDDEVGVTFDMGDQVSGVPSYGLPPKAQVVNGQYQAGLARTGLIHNVRMNIGLTFRWKDW